MPPPHPQSNSLRDRSRQSELSGAGESPAVVQLWHAMASPGPPGRLERSCECWLVADELERADRFVQPTSRNQHVVGRGMARRLLGGDRVPPQAICFEYLPQGKPLVRSPEAARRPFNVAHTDGLVVCGIGAEPNQWIGVDIERQDRRTDPGLAERYFSAPEVALLQRAVGETARRRLFLRIWTLKESFIKAIGTGLQTPLADFAFVDVETDTPQIRWIRPGLDRGRQWQFRAIELSPGYIAAVAVGMPGGSEGSTAEPLRVESRSFDQWLRG